MMDKPKKISKSNKIELCFYEKMGVLMFRRLILTYEKFRHRKDGLWNKNYHLQNQSITSIENFSGYLLYNSILHCISIFFTIIYFFLKFSFHAKWNVLDIVMCLLFLLNVYCLMLQRYNYLRMQDFRFKHYKNSEKQIKTQSEIILANFPAGYTSEQIAIDMQVLSRIKKSLEKGKDCYIGFANVESLERMAVLLGNSEVMKPSIESKSLDCEEHRNDTILRLVKECAKTTNPYSKVEKRVDWLQKKIGKENDKSILSSFAIITTDSESEKMFRRLFPTDSLEKIIKTIGILEEVFRIKMTGSC